jgi:hypothetical protein
MPKDEPLQQRLIFGQGQISIWSGSIRLRVSISNADVWMFDNEIDWVIYYKAEQGFVLRI